MVQDQSACDTDDRGWCSWMVLIHLITRLEIFLQQENRRVPIQVSLQDLQGTLAIHHLQQQIARKRSDTQMKLAELSNMNERM